MSTRHSVLNVSGFPLAQFEAENVLLLMVTNDEADAHSLPKLQEPHTLRCL